MCRRKTKACEEKKRAMKLARSTSLIGLNSQLKLNSKILKTWKKEREREREREFQKLKCSRGERRRHHRPALL
jgi:hypothetical protein